MEMDNRSVRLNKKSNLLKLDEYMYPLVDTDTPATESLNCSWECV